MAIEFRCKECDNLLRTPDEAAGKKARCPSCKSIQEVPGGTAPLAETAGFQPFEPIASPSQPQPTTEPVSTPANPFAAVESASSPYAAPHRPTASTRELALSKVRIPAIILLVITIPCLLFLGLATLATIFSAAEQGWNDDAVGGVVVCAVSMFFGLLVMLGTIQMLRLKSYGLAVAAMVLAIAPIACQVCLTFPFAVWGLIVLLDSSVKSEFG